ncbi:MAG: helix-turn-helix domain-containing protein [Aquabacterium sp.]|uniref:helix-turn-helix domain-containing protein n=1 Tax=Aquabacterium sp. TaxID=1872578 RepID=UPI0027283012|nr:helix-turn-helix domain-containing protein [Aquabacterium sp.]MDO9003828.1 helix-turn-helix domain-containing protein [Aquabacterium sp.]
MSDPTAFSSSSPLGAKAGDLLREARQAQNLEIDALASMIKVSPAKLEALESGRHDQLPDANFTRALAMTVCRSLKIDPAPVLAALPAAQAIPLSPQKPALNQPFKESRGANLSFDSGESFDLKALLKPQWLAPIVLLLASLVVYFMPASVQWPQWAGPSQQPATIDTVAAPASVPEAPVPSIDAVSAPAVVPSQADAAASSAAPEPAASQVAVVAPVALAASSPVVGAGEGPLVLKSSRPAWVEIRDGRGVLLSRHLKVGETVELTGIPPFKLHLGNSSALDVIYQGQPVELASHTRNNVARLELK